MKGAWLVTVVLLLACPAVRSAPPAPVLGGGSEPAAALAQNLRTLLLDNLPQPLHEDASHWGKRRKGPLGKVRNDGRWWKVRISAREPHRTLFLDIRDVQAHGKGRTTFRLVGVMDATVVLQRQTWVLGARLYSGETRARVRLKLALECEVQTHFEKPAGSWFPDTVIRLRVLRSDFSYDNLVVEHTAGVGGEAAELLGEVVIGIIRQVKPSLERNLLAKANAGIVKAADTKEIRISLSGLSGGKNPPAASAPKK